MARLLNAAQAIFGPLGICKWEGLELQMYNNIIFTFWSEDSWIAVFQYENLNKKQVELMQILRSNPRDPTLETALKQLIDQSPLLTSSSVHTYDICHWFKYCLKSQQPYNSQVAMNGNHNTSTWSIWAQPMKMHNRHKCKDNSSLNVKLKILTSLNVGNSERCVCSKRMNDRPIVSILKSNWSSAAWRLLDLTRPAIFTTLTISAQKSSNIHHWTLRLYKTALWLLLLLLLS